MSLVGLINYGGGNVSSVANALRHLNVSFAELATPDSMTDVSHIILPGVGAFDSTISKLSEAGWLEAIREQVQALGKPFLGICLGMQLVAEIGTEFTRVAGLRLVPGEVVRIEVDQFGLTVPHMGWNEVWWTRESPLTANLGASAHFYFVHSYCFAVQNKEHVLGETEYGGRLTAVVQSDNIVGSQFHPEKSQREGLLFLKNFCEWNP